MSEKKMYRAMAQSEQITITLHPAVAATYEEASRIAKENIPSGTNPFVLQDLGTEEEWNSGKLQFCPRCGNPTDYEDDMYECDNCDAAGDAYNHNAKENN